MTLKELYENCSAEQIKEIIFDYITKPLDYKATFNFEDYLENLEKCNNCDNLEEKEKMFDTEQIINGGVGLVCENCYKDLFNG